jgi:hypothetical protein
MGINDDVSYLNKELELILERQLGCIIFFYDFYFRDRLKYVNLELALDRLLEMHGLFHSF